MSRLDFSLVATRTGTGAVRAGVRPVARRRQAAGPGAEEHAAPALSPEEQAFLGGLKQHRDAFSADAVAARAARQRKAP